MALETAALDLRARQRNLSAPALLGAEPGARRPLAYVLGAPDAQGSSDEPCHALRIPSFQDQARASWKF